MKKNWLQLSALAVAIIGLLASPVWGPPICRGVGVCGKGTTVGSTDPLPAATTPPSVPPTSPSTEVTPSVTVVVSPVNGSYVGPCPPPKDATTYKAVISVSSGPVAVKFRWTTSNGGDTDPSVDRKSTRLNSSHI